MFPKSAICKIQHVPSTEDPKAVQEINIGNQPDGVVKRVFEVSLFQDPQNHPKGLRGSKPYGVCKKDWTTDQISWSCGYGPLWAYSNGTVSPMRALPYVVSSCGGCLLSPLHGMEMWQSSPRFHDLTRLDLDILWYSDIFAGPILQGQQLRWQAVQRFSLGDQEVGCNCNLMMLMIAVWFYVLKPFSHVS